MGKSRAEIQKAYRQRLKEKNNEDYLRRERERMRRNYVPSNQLSARDRARRNENNRVKLRRFYERKRAMRQRMNTEEQETSGYESANREDDNRGRLIVRIPIPNNRRKGALRRWKRDLSDANSRLRVIEQERAELKKKYKILQRRFQRMKQKKTQFYKDQKTGAESTPNKRTESQMSEADLNADQRKKLKRQLLLGNVLLEEIKSTRKHTSKGTMKALHRVVSGKIVKKYKCAKLLSKGTGLCRHSLSSSESKKHQLERVTRMSIIRRNSKQIETFLKREDNSKLQPGKADVKRISKTEKKQIYVLTDYLSNLYKKYKSENPETKISFTSFCRSRPKYILLTAFSSRSSCLCTKHQNAALTMKLLRREGIDIPANPEKAQANIPTDDMLRQNLPDNVIWNQWTRVEIEEKGKKKSVTKIVESRVEIQDFITRFHKQMEEFTAHVDRVAKQYDEIKNLKQNLPPHEMIIQLDFAENYSCRSMEEVQSAYFNQTSVTLHPMVAYFRDNEGHLQHKSIIVVSDEMGHKASTVIAFISDVMPVLKEIDRDLRVLHYWSDSPTSQYRNKYIFDLVANHEQLYEVKARWNFFEAGHGKGPCDGLGGSCKRLADEAMRSGKVIIQDANDFYIWAKKSNMINVLFRFVSAERCQESDTVMKAKPVAAVRGTMKIHAVVGLGDSQIMIQDVSCYCPTCLHGNWCDSWKLVRTRASEKPDVKAGDAKAGEKSTNGNTNEKAECLTRTEDKNTGDLDRESNKLGSVFKESEGQKTTQQPNMKSLDIGNFVATVYDGEWFIGKIVDKDENEYEVSFMEKKKEYFQWPRRDDVLWIKHEAVLLNITQPTATGKSKRMFKIEETDHAKIIEIYSAVK